MDKKSLYISGKIIAKNTRLTISLENKSGFSIDGQNFSQDTLVVKRELEKKQSSCRIKNSQ